MAGSAEAWSVTAVRREIAGTEAGAAPDVACEVASVDAVRSAGSILTTVWGRAVMAVGAGAAAGMAGGSATAVRTGRLVAAACRVLWTAGALGLADGDAFKALAEAVGAGAGVAAAVAACFAGLAGAAATGAAGVGGARRSASKMSSGRASAIDGSAAGAGSEGGAAASLAEEEAVGFGASIAGAVRGSAAGGGAGVATACATESLAAGAWATGVGAVCVVLIRSITRFPGVGMSRASAITPIASGTAARRTSNAGRSAGGRASALGVGKLCEGASVAKGHAKAGVATTGGRIASAGASGRVEKEASCELSTAQAGVRTPENLPAHPRQYFARSRLAVWHELQYLVMACPRDVTTCWVGKENEYFVTTFSFSHQRRLVRRSLMSVYVMREGGRGANGAGSARAGKKKRPRPRRPEASIRRNCWWRGGGPWMVFIPQ